MAKFTEQLHTKMRNVTPLHSLLYKRAENIDLSWADNLPAEPELKWWQKDELEAAQYAAAQINEDRAFRWEEAKSLFNKSPNAPRNGILAGAPIGAALGGLLARKLTKKKENERRNLIFGALGGGLLGAGLGWDIGTSHRGRERWQANNAISDLL